MVQFSPVRVALPQLILVAVAVVDILPEVAVDQV
jgi:hypothetical protein